MRLKLILLLLILSSSIASASVEVQRQEYAPGETVIATVQKEGFSPQMLSLLYNSTPVKTGIIFIGLGDNKHLAYFNVPASFSLGPYSLVMGNDTIEFQVVASNVSLAIRPPLVWLEDKGSFSISLGNVGIDSMEVVVGAVDGLTPARTSISLGPGDSKNLFVQYDASLVAEGSSLALSYGEKSYSIALMKIVEAAEEPEEPVEEPQPARPSRALVFDDIASISHIVMTDQKIVGNLSFRNVLEKNLHNATFHISDEFAYFTDFGRMQFPLLRPNKTYVQPVSFNTEKNVVAGSYKGVLLVDTAEGYSASIPITLSFEEPLEEPEEEEPREEPEVIEIEPFNLSALNQTSLGEEEPRRNIKLGIALLALIIIILGFITYRMWPRPVKKKFTDLFKK